MLISTAQKMESHSARFLLNFYKNTLSIEKSKSRHIDAIQITYVNIDIAVIYDNLLYK